MSSRSPFYVLVFALFCTGIALIAYRSFFGGVPLAPGQSRVLWDLEANITFESKSDEPIQVNLTRPQVQSGFAIVSESGASSDYGLSLLNNQEWPRAQWTRREAEGKQRLFYRALIAEDERAKPIEEAAPPIERSNLWQEPEITAAQSLVDDAWRLSADAYSFTLEILKQINSDAPNQNTQLLLNNHAKSKLALNLLHQAGIPARLVWVLPLEDGRRLQPLKRLLKVWQDDRSEIFNPYSGDVGLPDNMLLWGNFGKSILEVSGGRKSQVLFSIIRREESKNLPLLQDTSVLNFSIGSLPLAEQAMFKTILLLPIGALVVVFLRILIGIKTSGTFMPVLIALAFMETTLTTGLIGFILVVSVGLFFRSYLTRLNLLLVARISAVIIMVIAIIALFSLLSFQLGLTEGLKITFFPMIILAWTIERMSILWEEEGAQEVLTQGGGSLMVAIFAYLCMSSPLIRHITFNFLGLQLVILAIVLLMGSYTGYRLLELRRFSPLAKTVPLPNHPTDSKTHDEHT